MDLFCDLFLMFELLTSQKSRLNHFFHHFEKISGWLMTGERELFKIKYSEKVSAKKQLSQLSKLPVVSTVEIE